MTLLLKTTLDLKGERFNCSFYFVLSVSLNQFKSNESLLSLEMTSGKRPCPALMCTSSHFKSHDPLEVVEHVRQVHRKGWYKIADDGKIFVRNFNACFGEV